ncbi:FtsX-like permease family protein [Catellatospora sichuanensis]|uniref:FtsX-like permease family protein n=1 Tax=Catellatospora sichuanensis TaxID=1969805 RepID=UPI0011836E78|nr:FtsX-like permease family protein [Catellatospora sichuanensis]
MRWLRAWAPALRMSRREALRFRGRSVLVIAMIGLPVAMMSFVAATYDMHRLTPVEELTRQIGQHDAQVEWVADGPVTQPPLGDGYATNSGMRQSPPTAAELLAVLPTGSTVSQVAEGGVDVFTPDGIGGVSARGVDLADKRLSGFVELLSGVAPARADEVALNEGLADRLGVGVGGKIRTANPEYTYTVTAVVEFPGSLHETVVFRPDVLPPPVDWLVDTPSPVLWADVQKLNEHGLVVRSRAVALDPPAVPEDDSMDRHQVEEVAIGAIMVVLIMLEVVLLAGPAFAVGARRRSRDLALVAAAGGTPAHLRRIVLADGVVLGLGAAIAAVALGVTVAVLTLPLFEQYLVHARAGGLRIFPAAQLGVVLLAVGAGLAAAMVPAFTAARQSVVTVLAGRRGVTRSRKRWITLGTVLAAGGAVIAFAGAGVGGTTAIMAGLVLGELGLVLLTPSLVGLIARTGRWLPLAPRIALRDTARNRGSAAPAISAVMAAVAGAVAVGAFLGSDAQQRFDSYEPRMPVGNVLVRQDAPDTAPPPDVARVQEAVRQVLPGARAYVLQSPVCAEPAEGRGCTLRLDMPPAARCPAWDYSGPGKEQRDQAAIEDARCRWERGIGSIQFAIVDDAAALEAISSAPAADLAQARQTLAAGGLVVADPRYVSGGTVSVIVTEWQQPTAKRAQQDPADRPPVTVPAVALPSGTQTAAFAVATPALIQRLGLGVRRDLVIAAVEHVATTEETERLNGAVHAVAGNLRVEVELGAQYIADPIVWILGLVAALVALAAAGIATGLAVADGRADLATLGAVGASPRVRRLLSLSQSGVISGLGAVLGVLAGLGTTAVLIAALNAGGDHIRFGDAPMRLFLPWETIAIVLAVPLIAMTGAGLLTRSRLPIERRL